MLLTAMIFASNAEAHSRIQRRCVAAGDINLFPSPNYRPVLRDMVRTINSYSPELVFVEFQDRDDAVQLATDLRAAFPALAILGFADRWPHESMVKIDAGYVRVISSQISNEEFKEAMAGVLNAAKTPGPDNLIVFLPAKAGSGASTIALNVTGALANRCGKSTLLIEADLHSGPAGMYLNLNPTHSVVRALEESHQLEPRWNDLVTPFQNFGILPACNIHGTVPQPSPWAYRRLISFTQLRYEHVIFDLPEVVNAGTEAIVLSARAVYVVCTPEVPSLMLARKRCASLVDRGVLPERLKIVLNRYNKEGPEPEAVAEILGFPIAQVIPNDYKSLWEANLKRRLVAESTVVGRAFEAFAWSLTGKTVTAAPKSAWKRFSLFPAA